MSTVTLSLSARIIVNVEALNMAESVGNTARHRRAPVVVRSQDKYAVVYVPAVGGESLAHHYQRLLVNVAQSMNLPLTGMDKQGYFLKYSSKEVIKSYYPEVKNVINMNDPCEIEKALVDASVVADVGGFLYTDKLIKRTSRIKFGYMLPSLDSIERGAVATYSQLHVRYSPGAKPGEQSMYNIENGSALYVLSAVLNLSDIGKLEYCSGQNTLSTQRGRIEAAVKALELMIDGMLFGAKRSRNLPQWAVESMVVSLSKGPVEFVVSPGAKPNYAVLTAKRAEIVKKIGLDVDLFAYNEEGIEIPSGIQVASTHTGAIGMAWQTAVGKNYI